MSTTVSAQCRFLSYRTKKLSLASKSQTEKRMIRVATEIPEKCFPGSQLENVVFEIVKSDGVIDGTVNDNEKGDMSHAVVLKSDLTEIYDSVKCSFRHGCCPCCAIPLPQKVELNGFQNSASLDAISDGDSSYSPDKERMLIEIESSHTASSVVCKISRNKRTCDFSKDIIGVVALLGNVETNELGRILPEFLGEEQMLGVVCKSLKAAYNLETCDVDGSMK
uniref:Uncharacterized protein n=1 Tax=Daucus carota subsp. sativus TaxID=79200 RepID=A0A165ZLF6_DAUCS